MHTPTAWKTTLALAALSFTTVWGLGQLFIWAVSR